VFSVLSSPYIDTYRLAVSSPDRLCVPPLCWAQHRWVMGPYYDPQ